MGKKSRRPLFCASHTCPKKVSIFRRFPQENASQILNGTKKIRKNSKLEQVSNREKRVREASFDYNGW